MNKNRSPGAGTPEKTLPRFDAQSMEQASWGFLDYVLASPRVLTLAFATLQKFAWLTGTHYVYRYDQVRESFLHHKELPVGWGGRMIEVTTGEGTDGKNFVLGMPRDAAYTHDYRQLADAFPLTHIPQYITKPAADETRKIIHTMLQGRANGVGRVTFDAIEKVIHAVPTRLTGGYFGIPISNEEQFTRWTLAVSSYVFSAKLDKKIDPAARALALAGAAQLRNAIREGIQRADDEISSGIHEPYTVIRYLRGDKIMADKRQVISQMFGMVLGFIPTNVLAGGNMLETLLRNPGFLERTRMAANAGDDDLVWRCIREALRFRNINPAMWRHCPDGYIFADGRKIPPNTRRVLISAQAAMFDGDRVEHAQIFDPNRRDEDYMIFGVGQHWCLGAYIAKAQLTQTFKVLALMDGLRAQDNAVRTGRFAGIFPMHLKVSVKKDGP